MRRMKCWRFSRRAGPSGMLTRRAGATEESTVVEESAGDTIEEISCEAVDDSDPEASSC